MTIYYVSSSGSDTSPYDTWAKAATDIDTILALTTAGDEVRIESTYAKDWGADKTINFGGTAANPVKVISCTTSDVYQRGASLKATGGSYAMSLTDAGIEYYGLDFENAGSGYFTVGSSYCRAIFNDCRITVPGYPLQHMSSYGGRVIYENGTIITLEHGSYGYIKTASYGPLILRDMTLRLTGNDSSDYVFKWPLSCATVLAEDCDLTNAGTDNTGYLIDSMPGAYETHLECRRCRLPSANIFKTAPAESNIRHSATLWACYSGTDTDPVPWAMQHWEGYGNIVAVDTEKRTGGASDGTTSYSWKVSPTSGCGPSTILHCPPISKFVSAGSQTVTLYIASGSSLNDDDVWVEVESPSEASPATAQGKWRTTKPAPLVTGSALTTDSNSEWTGTGVGTKQKIEVTINPTEAGVVKITPFIATTNTLFIDPIVG